MHSCAVGLWFGLPCLLLLVTSAPVASSSSSLKGGDAEEKLEAFEDFDTFHDLDKEDEPIVMRVIKASDRPRDEDAYDEDEFEGFDTVDRTPPKPTVTSKKPARKTLRRAEEQQYVAELCAVVFIIIYILNFFLGRHQNAITAAKWFETFEPLFHLQFSALGHDTEAEITPECALNKQSQSCYQLYATGRRFCTGVMTTLELRKRHDLYSLLFGLVDATSTEDLMTVEVAMNADDMEPFVFAIARRRGGEKRLRKNHKDLEAFAGSIKSKLPASLVVLTDCPELGRDLLDDRSCRTIEKGLALFESLHFTDRGSIGFGPAKKVLRFTFKLPPNKDMLLLKPLLSMAIHFIDIVGTTRLTTAARARAVRTRQEVAREEFKATHQQRHEAMIRRKDERRLEESQREIVSVATLRPKPSSRDARKRNPRVKVMR